MENRWPFFHACSSVTAALYPLEIFGGELTLLTVKGRSR